MTGRRARALLSAFAMLAMGAFGVGCADATKVIVTTADRTNNGNVMHMMVRAVDAKTAATNESYQEASVMLFSSARDETVVSTEPLFPGKPTTLTLDQVDGKTFVLYFFFTSPGDNWRVQIPSPTPSEVYVDLGQNQISRIQVRR